MIRSYGNAMQGFMGGYLEKNLKAFQDMHQAMHASFRAQVAVGMVAAHLQRRRLDPSYNFV